MHGEWYAGSITSLVYGIGQSQPQTLTACTVQKSALASCLVSASAREHPLSGTEQTYVPLNDQAPLGFTDLRVIRPIRDE